MTKGIAKIISFVFHPVFSLTCLLSILVYSGDYHSYFLNPAQKLLLLIASFIFTVLLPLLNFIVLKKMGYIRSFEVTERSERILPYLSALVLHGGLFYILMDVEVPSFYKALVLVSFFVILVTFILNFFIRLSAHSSAAGAFLAILLLHEGLNSAPSLIWISIGISICGIIGSARLYLEAHTEKEINVGFSAGFLTAALLFGFWLHIKWGI